MATKSLHVLSYLAAASSALVALGVVLGAVDVRIAKLIFLALQAIGLLLAAAFLVRRRRRPTASVAAAPLKTGDPKAVLLGYAILVLPLAWYLNLGIYQADESAYLFQARTIGEGNLYVEVNPEISPAQLRFAHHVVVDGKLAGKYPIGWPMLLSVGTALDLEWLINPLLGLLLLGVTFLLGCKLEPRETARNGILLMLLSPFFTLNSIGFMSHVACAVFIAAATFCFFRYYEDKTTLWMSGMLICLSGAALVRPLTALCASVVLTGSMLWSLRRNLPRAVQLCAIAIAFASVPAGILAATNKQLTGSYLISPYSVYRNSQTIREISFRPLDLLENLTRTTPRRVADTAAAMFPFLLPLSAYALWRRRRERHIRLLAALSGSLVLGYLLQWDDSDSPIGERYYFEVFFAVALLGAAGWRQFVSEWPEHRSTLRVLRTPIAIIGLSSLIIFAHWQWQLRWPSSVLAEAARTPPFAEGIVFIVPTSVYPNPSIYNLNRPGTKVLFMPDPGPGARQHVLEASLQEESALLLMDPDGREALWGVD